MLYIVALPWICVRQTTWRAACNRLRFSSQSHPGTLRDQGSQEHWEQEIKRKQFRLLYLSLTFCDYNSMFCYFLLLLHKHFSCAPRPQKTGIFANNCKRRCVCFKLLVGETTAGWEATVKSNRETILHWVSNTHSQVGVFILLWPWFFLISCLGKKLCILSFIVGPHCFLFCTKEQLDLLASPFNRCLCENLKTLAAQHSEIK